MIHTALHTKLPISVGNPNPRERENLVTSQVLRETGCRNVQGSNTAYFWSNSVVPLLNEKHPVKLKVLLLIPHWESGVSRYAHALSQRVPCQPCLPEPRRAWQDALGGKRESLLTVSVYSLFSRRAIRADIFDQVCALIGHIATGFAPGSPDLHA